MKKGTGDDPFADEVEDELGSDAEKERREEAAQDEAASVTATTISETPGTSPVDDQGSSGTQSANELPYLARRQLKNKSVKADRDQVPFFLRERIQEGERDLRRAVEDELGQEVNKTDLREAAYAFAQRNPEGVAGVLREWGIEYLG